MPKYRVVRRFKDRFTGVRHRPGGTYETADPDRGDDLQRRGYLGEELVDDAGLEAALPDVFEETPSASVEDPETTAQPASQGSPDAENTSGEASEDPLKRREADGKVYLTDPETGFEFESGEGHPEHHAAADLMACKPAAELIELATAAGLEHVPDDLDALEGAELALAKWSLAERLVSTTVTASKATETKKRKRGGGDKATERPSEG
jgi:hypothetical protein